MIRPVSSLPRRNDPLSIRNFLGMDVTGTRDVRRSPDMLNCVLDDEGTPELRCGYGKLFPTSLGAGAILGLHRFVATNGTVTRLIHHGTALYKYTTPGAQPTLLYTGLSSAHKSTSFMLATKLCIIDGTNFLIFDGTTVVTAASAAYVPTFLIGTPPAGGGTRTEDLNLLNPRWYQKFTTVAGTKTYQLNSAPLDALELLTLNGTTLTLTTDYTVNLTTGLITLVADPGATTNGLIAKVRKASAVDATRITKCTVAAVYGGPNDSKVFLTGNPDYPHFDWWTGLPLNGSYDPTYWPDTNYDRVGGDNDPIVGYAVQYDKMLVFKRNSIYLRTYEITTDAYGRTVTRYPSTPINMSVGAYSASSIKLLDNDPFFLSDFGVYSVIGTDVRDERDVRFVSPLIGVKGEGLAEAADFNGKYYLTLADNKTWVCDYYRSVKDDSTNKYVPIWYPWSGLPVNQWFIDGDDLLFGSNLIGMVYLMSVKDGAFPYNDDGAAINAYYNTLFTTFDRDDQTKLVQSVIINMKMWARAEIDVSYATEEGLNADVQIERMVLLDFADIDFSDFSFDTSRLPKSFKVRIDDARNIQRFQLQLSSSGIPNEFFGFSAIDIVYQILSEVR